MTLPSTPTDPNLFTDPPARPTAREAHALIKKAPLAELPGAGELFEAYADVPPGEHADPRTPDLLTAIRITMQYLEDADDEESAAYQALKAAVHVPGDPLSATIAALRRDVDALRAELEAANGELFAASATLGSYGIRLGRDDEHPIGSAIVRLQRSEFEKHRRTVGLLTCARASARVKREQLAALARHYDRLVVQMGTRNIWDLVVDRERTLGHVGPLRRERDALGHANCNLARQLDDIRKTLRQYSVIDEGEMDLRPGIRALAHARDAALLRFDTERDSQAAEIYSLNARVVELEGELDLANGEGHLYHNRAIEAEQVGQHRIAELEAALEAAVVVQGDLLSERDDLKARVEAVEAAALEQPEAQAAQ